MTDNQFNAIIKLILTIISNSKTKEEALKAIENLLKQWKVRLNPEVTIPRGKEEDMTNKEFQEFLEDIVRILKESQTKEEAIEKIKDKYVKK